MAVAMDWKAPRTSSGASGFGSHVSIWLWPPLAKTRITDLARPTPGMRLAGSSLAAARLPREAESPASAPICSQSRRVTRPEAWRKSWQNRSIVNAILSCRGGGRQFRGHLGAAGRLITAGAALPASTLIWLGFSTRNWGRAWLRATVPVTTTDLPLEY